MTSISVKVIEDSISSQGNRLTTLQLKYPRFIHSQFMTHRQFSRNASSSRAIPVKKIISSVTEDEVNPVHWGLNQPGMQARKEADEDAITKAKEVWDSARCAAIEAASKMADLGIHKQITNRLLEPFQHIEVVCTATEWDNFLKLRLHEDSQPEIQALAKKIEEALNSSTPTLRMNHLPYITDEERVDEKVLGGVDSLRMISAARCARVSYLNHDGSECNKEKDYALAIRLYKDGHMSPFEHQAYAYNGQYANFKGWKSQRKMFEDGDNLKWVSNI